MKNNYKFWIAFSFIAVFIAGAAGGILFQKHILDKKSDRWTRREGHAYFPTLDRMARELNLTPVQQEQIQEIFKNNEERLKKLRTSIHDQISVIREKLKKEIENILNAEQKKKFQSLIEKYISSRKKEVEGWKKRYKKSRPDDIEGEEK